MLKKIGLIKSFQLSYDLDIPSLVNYCNEKIDAKDSFHNLIKGAKNYAGSIEKNNLVFKHKRSIFSGLLSYPKVYAEIKNLENSTKSIIQFDVYGFTGIFIVLSILLVLALLSQLFFMRENQSVLIIFFLVGFSFIYLISLMSVKLLANKLTKDFKQ